MNFLILIKLFFIVCLSKEFFCKKITSYNTDGFTECRRCKILTDSFQHWLDKTARGKYEGGDSAWEEAKLKSYAHSEIRLTEVQEGLCSEVNKEKDKDHCYSLAEEAEQVFEKWWFLENRDTADLFSWICVENLKYCCPKKHFGEFCKPCPTDINNNVCNNHGKCDGEGTRSGNGTCICKKGYSGKHCEECDENFYRTNNNLCDQCHIACNGCRGKGPSACIICKSGWLLDSEVCRDINECIDTNICKSGQFCENLEGSYVCRKCEKSCKTCLGPGSSNCTSCESKYILWSGSCFNNYLKNDIFFGALKRVVIYFVLLIISFLTFRRSKLLTSFIVIIFAVFIYFFENQSGFNILDSAVIYLKKIEEYL